MLVETVYGGFECVGLEFQNNVFLFNPTENFNCKFKTRGKNVYVFQTVPNAQIRLFKDSINFKPSFGSHSFKVTNELGDGTEVSIYPYGEQYAVLVKKGKFRFFYMDSNYMFNIKDQLIHDIVADLKKFFVRRIDIAFLPLVPEDNSSLTNLLLDLKPKRFAPLLPTNDPGLIENFVRENIFEKTSILIYTRKCDRFKFNLI